MSISILKVKQASKTQFNAQLIETVTKMLYAVSPYAQSKDPQVRMKVAKKVTRNILKALNSKQKIASSKIVDNWVRREAADVLQRTYNQRGDNSEPSKAPIPSNDSKQNPRSRYDLNNCVQRKQADGLPTDEAVLECNEELGGKSTMAYTDSNTSKNAVKSGSALDGIWYGQNARAADTENYTTKIPYWVSAIGLDENDLPIGGSGNNIRSAAVAEQVLGGESIESILERNRINREQAKEVKTHIFNAKKNSNIPAWAQVAGGLDG